MIARFSRSLVSAGWFLGSAILSVLWAIHFYTYTTEETVVGDLFRFGPLGVSLNSFVHWGWIFVLALLLWAFHSTDSMQRGRRDRQVAAAATSTGSLGQAGFATSEDLRHAKLTGAKFGQGIRLGFDKETGDVIRYQGEAHGIMVAPARSGKFRDVICAMTLEWKHSMVIIDPKGQIAAVTKKEREKLGRVFVLNPFETLPEYLGPSACYNPMSALDPKSKSFDAECDALADAIVVHEGGGDAHWSDSARLLVSGGIMHLTSRYPADECTLGNLRDIVCTSKLIGFCKSAIAIGDEFAKQKLGDFAEVEADNKGELRSIVSNAKTQTGFITKAISESLARSDFQFRDLKKEPITVYVVLPTRMFGTAGKWFRLIVASALSELMREERGLPVLAILDEFAQLGHLKAMRDAMGQSAGMGLQVLPVLQDLNQLKTHYKDGWETFLANTEFRQFFKSNDVFTQEYVSKLSGLTTVKVPNASFGESTGGGNSSSSNIGLGEQAQPVLQPYEVGRVAADEFLMFAQGVDNVIRGSRAPYFDKERCPELQGRYSQDPYHLPK